VASKVAAILAPVGAKIQNERQARELTRLQPEDIQRVASEIDLSTATATEVKKVVANLVTPTASNRKPKAELRTLAAQGYRDSQIAKELGISTDRVRELATEGEIKLLLGHRRAIDVNRVMNETIVAVEGLSATLELISVQFSIRRQRMASREIQGILIGRHAGTDTPRR